MIFAESMPEELLGNVSVNIIKKVINQFIFRLLNDTLNEQLAFQRAIKEFVGGIDTSYAKENEEFHVGFEGSFGAKHVTPRTLTSRFLGNLVCVEGIVTKCRALN